MKRNLLAFITPAFFFMVGIILSFTWDKNFKKVQAEDIKPEVQVEQVKGTSSTGQYTAVVPALGQVTPVSKKKLTIAESKAITATKTAVETGENVNFSVTLKNTGTKTKHLTHLCFSHSGGVTFGCLNGPQGPNLSPGEEKSFGAGTMFYNPGTYSVWVTWSQDKTNFYRPSGGSSVKITVE